MGNYLSGAELTSGMRAEKLMLINEQVSLCAAAKSAGLKQSISLTVFWFLAAAGCFLMSARTLRRDAIVRFVK